MKTTTLFEQVIIMAQRTRELRDQRYGSVERGMFSISENKRLPKIIDIAINDFETGEIGREYLDRAIDRARGARGQRKKRVFDR
jgi:DNA-directed RNA polymerase subunit K/omega